VISLNPATAAPERALGNDEVEMANLSPQPVKKWAAIAGRWKLSGKTAEYDGPNEPGISNPVGLARASGGLRGDAVIRTRIKLSRTEKTSGGILFGFQAVDSPYFAATLGAFERAYAVVEYRGEVGWLHVASAGLLSNLNSDSIHDLQVSITGQSVRLTVDEVEVLSTVVPRPIDGTGSGLYAWDDALITFGETTVLSSDPKVFVIMPFKEPFDTFMMITSAGRRPLSGT
jgi:hypothetical protein